MIPDFRDSISSARFLTIFVEHLHAIQDASWTSEIAQNAISKSEHVWHITGSKYPNRDRTTRRSLERVVRELQAAPAKAAMAEALSIDMHEMKAISPETEPEHSHATGMIIDLNDVVSNIVMDAERARMSRVA